MAYLVNEGEDHGKYINPYDNAIVNFYISKSKNNFSVYSISGGDTNGTLLIDLEALCAPQGPQQFSIPHKLGYFSDSYRNLVLKNIGQISQNRWSFNYWGKRGPRTLYFSGRTNIHDFPYVKNYFDNIYADQAALTYSGLTASNFYGTVANPPARSTATLIPATWIKVNGNYQQAKNYIKIAQEWRPVRNVYQKVNGVWKLTSALETYYFCDVYDDDSSGWIGNGGSAYKRGGFARYNWFDCGVYDTKQFRTNEMFIAFFKIPPLEGFNSKRCYICNGSESPKYELVNAAAINTGTYKIQFTGSVFKVIP